ncbi:MAG: alkaline phosphatase family protein [Anaerolineae bacterium]
MAKRRTVIVGLDGMPFGLIKDFTANETMPHTGRLIESGAFRQMASSIPEISSVAWSSIITGTNPGEHGIFGFTDLAPGTYRLTFPNFNSLKASPFWMREGSERSVILNVPSTFPARPLNGVQVAGFVALDLERATYPPSLVPWLRDADYRVDVDSQAAHKSLDLFLRDLERTLQARITAYRYLWEKEDWDTFMLVFTGTDRLAHFLWDAYEDKEHPYRAAFLNHLHQVDEVIGEIAQRIADEDVLILLSDHGFEALESDVYVNFFLRQEGFLKIEKDPPRGLQDIANGTQAFALDPGRIYINIENKYPRGAVPHSDREILLDELTSALQGLEIDGRRVVKRVYRKEEIFEGPWHHQAPDLVMLANEGFNLRGSIKAQQLYRKGAFTGKHSQADAFLFVRGEFGQEIMPDYPCVSDVVNIMDRLRLRK